MNANYRPAYLLSISEHDQPLPLRPIFRPYAPQFPVPHDPPEPFSEDFRESNPGFLPWHTMKDFKRDEGYGYDDSPLHNKPITCGLYDYDHDPSYYNVSFLHCAI